MTKQKPAFSCLRKYSGTLLMYLFIFNSDGVAFFIGSRLSGLCSIGAIYVGLHCGVDIPSILGEWNFPVQMEEIVGRWALAMALSSLAYPLTFTLTGQTAGLISAISKIKS